MEPALRRMTDLPPDQRPRERLRRLGVDALTDAEIVAVLIGAGRPGANAIETAQRLIDHVGGMGRLVTASFEDIEQVDGLGAAAAARIVVSSEVRRRAALADRASSVSGTAGIAAAVLPHLQDRSRERLVLAVLDRQLRVIDVVHMPEGVAAHARVPTADVLRVVLTRGARAFAVAHNHPGGSPDPSPADIAVTAQLAAAAEACGLRFLDHIVTSSDEWRTIRTQEANR